MEGIIQISGKHNDRLAAIRKVREGKDPDRVFIEGLRLTREVMLSDAEILECVMTAELLHTNVGQELARELLDRGTAVIEVPDQLIGSLADTVNSQGIILVAKRPRTGKETVSRAANGREAELFVFLQRISDPSNLGAVYRTAEAAGVEGVIVSSGAANVFSPKAVRASMGANFRVPTWENAELEDCANWAREAGLFVRAADITGSKSHTDVDWRSPSLIVFGSEAHGLSQEDLSLTDEVFKVPMQNDVESLNLAVSAGIVLFEARRQNT